MTTDDAARAPNEPSHAGDDAAVPVPDGEHFVYVLRCGDDTLYTGYTTDVERRVAEHQEGEGAKYTRGRTPVELVHVEGFEGRSAAMVREHAIKTRSRSEKLALVRDGRDDGQ